MDIPNLSTNTEINPIPPVKYSLTLVLVIILASLSTGYILSRIFPKLSGSASLQSNNTKTTYGLSTDNISKTEDLKVGVIYGNQQKVFKDSAVGILEKGNINGEGTHILNRAGGLSQRASLTSSTVDLDLFVGKNVEIKGETNSSNKTSWLIDVGSIKILE